MSVFVKAACGCIVIPLGIDEPNGSTKCICVRSCEQSDGSEWSFHPRSFDKWKVVKDAGRDYSRFEAEPRPLGDAETATVMVAIGHMIVMGYAAKGMADALARLARLGSGIPVMPEA